MERIAYEGRSSGTPMADVESVTVGSKVWLGSVVSPKGKIEIVTRVTPCIIFVSSDSLLNGCHCWERCRCKRRRAMDGVTEIGYWKNTGEIVGFKPLIHNPFLHRMTAIATDEEWRSRHYNVYPSF